MVKSCPVLPQKAIFGSMTLQQWSSITSKVQQMSMVWAATWSQIDVWGLYKDDPIFLGMVLSSRQDSRRAEPAPHKGSTVELALVARDAGKLALRVWAQESWLYHSSALQWQRRRGRDTFPLLFLATYCKQKSWSCPVIGCSTWASRYFTCLGQHSRDDTWWQGCWWAGGLSTGELALQLFCSVVAWIRKTIHPYLILLHPRKPRELAQLLREKTLYLFWPGQ